MSAWEYNVIRQPATGGPLSDDSLNHLAGFRWELVSLVVVPAVQSGAGAYFVYVFKRPGDTPIAGGGR